MRTFLLLLDWVVLPACIVVLAWEPNFRDGHIIFTESGQFLAAIRELQNGGLLFRDIFVQYSQLQYFVPAWSFSVFGDSIAVLRGYFLFGEITSLLTAYALARWVIRDRTMGLLAGLLIVIESHDPFWSTRWGGFRFAFLYLSLFFLVRAASVGLEERSRWLIAAGAAAGLGFLHSYEVGAIASVGALLFFLAAALRSSGAVGERIVNVRELAGWAFGFTVVLLPFFAHLLVTETLGSYWNQLPLGGSGRLWVQPIDRADLSPVVLAPALVFVVSSLLLGATVLRRQWDERLHVPLLLVTGCGALLYGLAFRAIRGPQFETCLPLVVITVWGWLALAKLRIADPEAEVEVDRVGRRAVSWGLLTIGLLAFAIVGSRIDAGGWGGMLRHQIEKSDHVARHRGRVPLDERLRRPEVAGAGSSRVPREQAEQIEGVVAEIQKSLEPDEALFAYPDLGILNYLADRPHATRFIIPIFAAAREEWSDELMEAISTERPRIVVLGTRLSTFAKATRHRGEYLPLVAAWVRVHYDLKTTIGSFRVYELSDGVDDET